jgi:hypothetical protein
MHRSIPSRESRDMAPFISDLPAATNKLYEVLFFNEVLVHVPRCPGFEYEQPIRAELGHTTMVPSLRSQLLRDFGQTAAENDSVYRHWKSRLKQLGDLDL